MIHKTLEWLRSRRLNPALKAVNKNKKYYREKIQMKIISAGFPKTGTKSASEALRSGLSIMFLYIFNSPLKVIESTKPKIKNSWLQCL